MALDSVKSNIESGRGIKEGAIEEGRHNVEEYSKLKEIYESIPDDIDPEISSAVEQAEGDSHEEVVDVMEGDVRQDVESAQDVFEDAKDEANEQSQKHEDAERILDSAAGNEFGQPAQEAANAAGEQSNEYLLSAEEANQEMEDVLREFEQLRAELDG